jgi:hypothetical protein
MLPVITMKRNIEIGYIQKKINPFALRSLRRPQSGRLEGFI